LEIGGSYAVAGNLTQRLSRMICSSATQINMVSATVEVDSNLEMSLHLTRLPSDLNYLRAHYWDLQKLDDDNVYVNFGPYERFTLTDNQNSPTAHFISHPSRASRGNVLGAGSGGNAFSSVGHIMLGLTVVSKLTNWPEFGALSLLDDGFNQINFKPNLVTKWMGEVGASYITTSVGYNGWAAWDSSALRVIRTGGQPASCYKPFYALAFLPLVLAATVIIFWTLVMQLRSSLSGVQLLKDAYAGLGPYTGAVCPGVLKDRAVLKWESMPTLHLRPSAI